MVTPADPILHGATGAGATGISPGGILPPPSTSAPGASTSVTGTIGGIIPPPPTTPLKPTMGGLLPQGAGTSVYYVAWTGGKPNNTWTGLTNSFGCVNALQTRSKSPKAASSYASRQAGLYPGQETLKFSSGGDLPFFIKKIRDAFVDFGMDTICYRRDPLDSSVMVDVLSVYPRLNQESMLDESRYCFPKFDSYDKSNDVQARKFLLASLDIKLEKLITNKSSPTDTFVDVFFTLLEEERPQTVDRSQAIIDRVKGMSPTDFPNQNISLYVSTVKPLLEDLEIGRVWDAVNNNHLCRVLANCGGENNYEYSGPLFILLNNIASESRLITHLSNQQKAAHMTKKKLGWRDILKLAETQYKAQTVETRVRWPPACHAHDSKAAPQHFGSAHLTQYAQARNGRGSQKGQKNYRNGGKSTNKTHGKPDGSNGKNPKFIPPDSSATPIKHVNGKPVYEKVINGKTMQWCGKCKRYSTTHNTGTHTGKPSSNHSGNPDLGSASLGFGMLPDPSLWLASHCIPIMDPPKNHPPESTTFDPALAPTPTWSSAFRDFSLLAGPHTFGLLFLVSILNLPDALHYISCGVHWFSAISLGDIFQFLLAFAAPMLWFALLLLSVSGKTWTHPSMDPRPSAPIPQYTRKTIRLAQQHRRRYRRKYYRHLTVHNRTSRSPPPFPPATVFSKPLHRFKGARFHGNRRWKQSKSSGNRRWKQSKLPKLNDYNRKTPKRCMDLHRLDLTDPVFKSKSMSQSESGNTDSISNPSVWLSESVVLQHPKACQAAMATGDTFTVIWDSGASFCVTFDKKDFIGPIKALPKGSCIKGIANNLRIEGVGEVCWSIMDETGKLRHLKLPSYYIPKLKQRLLSTTVFNRTYPKNPITISGEYWKVSGNPSDPTESSMTVCINPRNNLPVSTCFRQSGVKAAATAYSVSVSAIHTQNFNLSEPQKELLRWHYRLGHIGLRTVQFIMRTGVLASSESMRRLHTAASKVPAHDMPRCAACQFGRQTNRSVPGRSSAIVKDRSGILSADQLQPGQRIFIDHFMSTTRGRKIKGYGIKEPSDKSPSRGQQGESYCGGCMFVDASTGFVHAEFQSHLSSDETIQAVDNFESMARDNGIIISEYASDNGSAFTSTVFKNRLHQQGQVSRFSGAGSHHQNGKAERCIRTIIAMARTMLLHAAVHWPEMADASLWALSVQHAVWLYNHLPSPSTGLSPMDLWSKTRFPLRKLHDLHVFGSPVYVLQKRLSDGKSIGKWQPRSNRCVNLGFSDRHAKSVPLVLNPSTGSITPQWNVIFDDWFSTVATTDAELPDFNADEWSKMFGTTASHFPDEDPLLMEETVSSVPTSTQQMLRTEKIADRIPSIPLAPAPPMTSSSSWYPYPQYPQPTNPLLQPLSSNQPFQEKNKTSSVPAPVATTSVSTSERPDPKVTDAPKVTFQDPVSTPAVPTASNRPNTESLTTPPATASPSAPLSRELQKLADFNTAGNNDTVPLPSKRIRKPRTPYGSLSEVLACQASSDIPEMLACFASSSISTNELPPHIYHQLFAATKNKDPDTLSYDQAMADTENLSAWLAASANEIKQLEDKNCWEECLKSEANGEQIIPSTWVFRRKRNPAGDITKYKARICLRGDLMDGDEESFAPVCSWSSVRFFLVLAIIMQWKTVSVDWNNAFIQAILKKPIYMAVPRGFSSKYGSDGCVRLLRSLYGSKFAPRNWYMHLRKALLELGFKESAIDPCLLYKENILMVLYVDDAGIAAPSKDIIDKFVKDLKDLNFDLDIEDDFNSYLGIGIEEFPDGSRHMTQKGLIRKILNTTKMTNCNPNWFPASQVALGSDPDGEPYDQEMFSYSSVVGMLLYLSNNTRPDITFAVSQVARFTHSPKKTHAAAVKSIIRYLARTQDKGIIVQPDGSYNLRCWVDADFSGLHGREPESNASSAKSRYGYIITFAGVPLVWKSQLISEICLSTLHAEYVGLVSAVRAMIPIRSLTVDVLSFLDLPSNKPVEVHCTVFEDNQGAYLLATNQRITSRTKYFNVKYHFFWSFVYHPERNPHGWLVVIKCPTDKMNADYLTKGLGRVIYQENRLRVQGW
jgi:hypothetical protein